VLKFMSLSSKAPKPPLVAEVLTQIKDSAKREKNRQWRKLRNPQQRAHLAALKKALRKAHRVKGAADMTTRSVLKFMALSSKE